MKKGRFTTALLFLIFFAGLSLLLYPSVSDFWNSMHQSRAITYYAEKAADISQEEYGLYIQAAKEYNEHILTRSNMFTLSDDEKAEYEGLLNISGNGVIGYIEIPTIDVTLPIYHGTSDNVLQVAVGHLEWTSLPVGGNSTHCVLSGHRGLPSAKLFTHLDKLVVGDTFMIRVLDEILTYEVDQILIVEPQDIEALKIVDGEDYCTLLTCTPYGINTHRLLVRGHRIENAEQAIAVHITAEAMQIEPMLVASVISVVVLFLMLLLVLLGDDKRHKGSNRGGKINDKKNN